MKITTMTRTSACKFRAMTAFIVFALAFTVMSRTASAQTVLDDPLHGVCVPACPDSGSISPTTSDPVQFGFTMSPASSPSTGDLLVVLALPIETGVTNPSSITITNPTATPTMGLAGTALEHVGIWSTGQLDTFLGISGSPTNPNGNFQAAGSGTTYDVYVLNEGTETLQPQSTNTDPIPTGTLFGVVGLPQFSYIFGFLELPGTTSWVATANSGVILENGTPRTVTPEPSSLLLLGTGALALAGVVRRRYMRRV